ncbi:glycosyltransferase [Amycolatopsis sp. NBC_00348]|uniref:glycosyltransferase family 2 protein n=1 Tax=Amycolatopsis sp. NBC_00348 TaxID=2975956 RepID=UPI002E2705D8
MGQLVSIVVPNHNGARTLPQCLSALSAQTHPDLEVIVSDDGSTDDSVAVARAHGAHVVATGVNGGCGVARNAGRARARGDVIFYVDSDVALAPDAVATAVRILEAEPDTGAVCGIQDPEPLVEPTLIAQYRGLQYHYWSLSSQGTVSFLFPSLCAIPAKVHDEIGGFNPRLKQTEEVDFGHRLSRHYRLRLTPEVRGKHAHDRRLKVLLRKLFHRARLRIPLYARSRHFATGFETRERAWASLAAAASIPAFAAAFAGPWGLLAPGLLIAASIAGDRGMYGFVRQQRGPAFTVFFAGVHYLVNLTIVVGAVAGVTQWTTSRAFRRLYEQPATP